MCSHTFDTSINGVPRIVKERYDNVYRDLPTHLISRGALIIRKMCLLLTVVVLLCERSNIGGGISPAFRLVSKDTEGQ